MFYCVVGLIVGFVMLFGHGCFFGRFRLGFRLIGCGCLCVDVCLIVWAFFLRFCFWLVVGCVVVCACCFVCWVHLLLFLVVRGCWVCSFWFCVRPFSCGGFVVACVCCCELVWLWSFFFSYC